MYALKGTWVGQTFAMAKGNESEGRKSRIRRSKEERKELVESFIKNYQIASNGNFPSLNLTHKEIGGSFYTVREIVREIIQENRVLGPAKPASEEQNTDLMSEQYLLGSLSMAPQIERSMDTDESESAKKYLIDNEDTVLNSYGQSVEQMNQTLVDAQILCGSGEEERNNGVDDVTCEHLQMATSETEFISNSLVITDDVILNSYGQCMEPKSQTLVEFQIVNGSEEVEKIKEADDLICDQLQAIDTLEVDKSNQKDVETSATSQFFKNVIVETFPLTPGPDSTYGLAGDSDDIKLYSDETLLEKVEHEYVSSNGRSPEKYSSSMDKSISNDAHGPNSIHGVAVDSNDIMMHPDETLLENIEHINVSSNGRSHENYSSLMGKLVPNDGSVLVEISSGRRNEIPSEILDDQNIKCPDSITECTKDDNSPNGKPSNINGTNACRRKESGTKKTIVKNMVDSQPSSSFLKESKPTHDRINLESWEGASKKPADRNPVVAILNAFVAAFVKFWT